MVIGSQCQWQCLFLPTSSNDDLVFPVSFMISERFCLHVSDGHFQIVFLFYKRGYWAWLSETKTRDNSLSLDSIFISLLC